MKILLALMVLAVTSQVEGYAAGQVVTVREDASKYCTDCTAFFGDIHQILSSPNTSAMITQFINEMVCEQMQSVKDICKGMVNEVVPQILNYVAGFDNPQELCGILGMCTESVATKKPKFTLKLVGGDVECSVCKMGITELRSLLRDATAQNDVKYFLKTKVCTIISSLTAECKQAVDQYATLLFQLLVNELDPTVICDYADMCTKTEMRSLTRVGLISRSTSIKVMKDIKPAKVKKVSASGECILCETIMTELDQIMTKNTTILEIENALDNICKYLPGEVSGKCVEAVQLLVPELLNLLKQMGPKAVCTELGLCSQGMKKVPTLKPRMVGGNETCILCEFVLKELDAIIGNNKSEANVKKALETLCDDVMPSTIRQECKAFVEAYSADIINLITQELDPAKICTFLRLCTNVQAKPAVEKTVASGPLCPICEFIMTEVDTLIGNNRTEAAIRNALDQVCNLLPSTLTTECKSFIAEYEPAIIGLLLQELDPRFVCTALGLCGNTTVVKAKLVKDTKPLKAGGEACSMCMLAVDYALNFLKKNGTVKEIEQLLDDICQRLPSGIDTQCETFVNQYAPLVLQLLEGDITASEVCKALKLCPGAAAKTVNNSNKLYFKSKLLGEKECTFGPSHWCKNKRNAIKCNAVNYCMKHAWN